MMGVKLANGVFKNELEMAGTVFRHCQYFYSKKAML